MADPWRRRAGRNELQAEGEGFSTAESRRQHRGLFPYGGWKHFERTLEIASGRADPRAVLDGVERKVERSGGHAEDRYD